MFQRKKPEEEKKEDASPSMRRSATGMPDEEHDTSMKPWAIAAFASQLNAITGLPMALAVYYLFGYAAKYDKNLKSLFSLFGEDVGYMYLSVFLLCCAVNWVIFYPFALKNSMKLKKNLRANMYIYAMIGENAVSNKIVLDEEGTIGKYNRATRSMHHMFENLATFAPTVLLSGIVCPFPTLVCVAAFSVGRFMHQKGYAVGYGKHGAGYAISVLPQGVLHGMMMVVYLKSAGVLGAEQFQSASTGKPEL